MPYYQLDSIDLEAVVNALATRDHQLAAVIGMVVLAILSVESKGFLL